MSVRFELPIIYLITAGEATDSNFALKHAEILETCRLAVDAGVSMIQIREKRLCTRNLFELASALATITRPAATLLLVNDRPDVAFAAGADGVHLTSRSLSAEVVRNVFPKDFIIGVSTHTGDEVADAAKIGADFAVFGPIFQTPRKEISVGLQTLRTVCLKVDPFPVVGLGGIDEANCITVLEAGAQGIAAIRSLNDPVSLADICRKVKDDARN